MRVFDGGLLGVISSCSNIPGKMNVWFPPLSAIDSSAAEMMTGARLDSDGMPRTRSVPDPAGGVTVIDSW